jgi:hypothetical protein
LQWEYNIDMELAQYPKENLEHWEYAYNQFGNDEV